MAAPSNAYRTKTVRLQKESEVTHLLAILQVDKATHLDRFYLDDILAVRLEDGTEGVIGIVNEGSNNFYMHNTSRHGSGRHGSEGIWLNDGGLNTLDKTLLGSNGFLTLWANYMRAHLEVKASWYNNTTAYGFEFKKPADSVWTRVALSPAVIPQKTTLSQNWRLPAGFEPLTNYQIRFFNTNAEGTWINPTIYNVTTGPYIIEEQFQQRTVACTTTATEVILFIPSSTRSTMATLTGTPVTADLYAWTGENFDTPPAQGWYFSHDDGYSYYYDSNFGFTHRQFCQVVPTIKVSLSVTIYESGYWTVTAMNLTGTNFTSPITIYALAVGKNAGIPIENIPLSVTIPANQSSGMNSEPHSADFVTMLDWELGGYESSDHYLVLDNEINGLIGIGI